MAAVPRPKLVEASGEMPDACVALRVEDNSMEDTFHTGELIYVELGASPQDKEYVIAKVGDGTHVLRRYIDRQNGVFDLQAENAALFPTLTSNKASAAEVIGVVIEHHKRYRR